MSLQRMGILPASIKPNVFVAATKIEVWASGFKDNGPDYTEVRVMGQDGLIYKCIIGGY